MANITVSAPVHKFMQSSQKRDMQDLLTVPLPFAAFTHTLTQSQWSKAAKFTSTRKTAVTPSVKSTTGYARILNHDGTWQAVVGTGNPAFSIVLTSKAPPTDGRPSFYAIIPCDASGNVNGDLTSIFLNGYQVTSFDGTGLSSLTILRLASNQLTSFDGTGLSSLIDFEIYNNYLTSFDGTGLSSLTNLEIYNNQLTSFDATGLSSLTDLRINNNQLTSFDATGLSSVTYLDISNNQLTSFNGTALSSATTLYLNNNQLTSFDGTGLSSLTRLRLYNNQLASFENLSLPVGESINIEYNNLSSTELDELYTALGVNQGNLSYWYYPGIYVTGNPGTTGDDPSIATAKGHTVYGS